MTGSLITPLTPSNIKKVWPQVSEMLLPLVEEMRTHTIDDVYRLLMGGVAQLWVQWNGGIEAAITTLFIPYPQLLSLRLWLAAADDEAKIDWDEWRKTLLEFALDNKCGMVEAEGREGWGRIVGMDKVGSIYRSHIA